MPILIHLIRKLNIPAPMKCGWTAGVETMIP